MKTLCQIVKRACLLCLPAFFLLAETGLAQPQGRGRGIPDSAQTAAMVDTLAKKLSLSKEQKEKVGKIYFAAFAESRKAFEQNQGNFQAMREARMKITEKRDSDIKALLNDDQKKLYDKILEEQRAERQRRMSERMRNQ